MVEPGEAFLVQLTPPDLHFLNLLVDLATVLLHHQGFVWVCWYTVALKMRL